MNRDTLQEQYDDDLLFADGFDEAIVGITTNGLVVYDVELMICVLVSQGMGYTEAVEYLEFNVFCAYVGENTPIYMTRYD